MIKMPIKRELIVISDGITDVKLGDVTVRHNLYILKGDNTELEFITMNDRYKKKDMITLTLQDFSFPRSLEMQIMKAQWKKAKKQDDYFLYWCIDSKEFFKLKIRLDDKGLEAPFRLKDYVYINITKLQKSLDESIQKEKEKEKQNGS